MFNKFVSLRTIVFVFVVNQGSTKAHNWIVDEDQVSGKGRARRVIVEQNAAFTPITTYPSDVPTNLPWENEVEQLSLQCCTCHHVKLHDDLGSLNLPPKSRQSLEIVLHSLQKIIDV